MEYNTNNNEQQPIIQERDGSSKSLWYWIIGLILIALLGWWGYTAGWFSSSSSPTIIDNVTSSIPVERDNGIGDGALPLNAAPIDSLLIETLESFPVKKALVVKGTLPNGCTYLNQPQYLRDGNVFYITLDTYTEDGLCTQAVEEYEQRIPLQVNNLPAGVYIVNINGREISFELEGDNTLDFEAGSDK